MITRHLAIYAALIGTCSLLLSVPHAQVQQTLSGSTELAIKPPHPQCDFEHENLLLLTSEPKPFVRAWLLCLDGQKPAGWLYAAPFVLSLSSLGTRRSALQFDSEALPDQSHYTLTLESLGKNTDGSLTLHTAPASHGDQTYMVHAAKVDKVLASAENTFIGRYSNAEYIEESGDLVGCELLFFSVGQHLTGLATFYEGYWGEPVFISLPLQNVEMKNDAAIRFQIQLETAVGQYQGTFQDASLTLYRTGVPLPPDASEIRLKKQHYLLPDRTQHQ